MTKIKVDNDISYKDTSLSANMEDYIETIAMLSDEKKVVRVKDIAKRLNIKMPSVSNALNKLKEKKLINYEKYGYVELTPEGKKTADHVYSKHSCLTDFFHKILQMSEKKAEKEACRIEHHLSPIACKQIHRFLDFHESELTEEKEWTCELRGILEQKKLSELIEGDCAEIIKIRGKGDNFRRRLLEMGFRKGVRLRVIKYAPLLDPMLIEIKDFQISLRVNEAENIIVKTIKDYM